MSEKTKKTITKISGIGLVGLFLTVFLYMADLVYYPAFIGTMEAFPEADMNILNFCMTGSQLTAMLAAFAVIPLMRRFDKKTLLLVCTALFGVCAICTPLVPDITFVAVMRGLSGLGFGGILGLATSLIQQVYRGDKAKRDKLVGLYNGSLSLCGAVNSAAGGILAAISWDTVFKFYWIAVPIFLLILFFVPRTPADKDDEAAQAEAQAQAAAATESDNAAWHASLPKIVLASLAYMFVTILFMAVASGQCSVYVVELGLGDSTTAGYMCAFANIVGFFSGIVFAGAFHRMKRFLPVFFYGVMTIGLVLYCIGGSIIMLSLGLACEAFGYAVGLAYYMVYAAESAPASKSSTAITFVTIAMCLGGFVSPYVVTALQAVLGTTLLGPIYPPLLAAIVIATVLSLICAVRSKKKGEVYGDVEEGTDAPATTPNPEVA